jgi:biopolymer transport protein ExbB/TolQ
MTDAFGSQIELAMYELAQLFLIPVLLAVALLFAYAFIALGGFLWQWLQRRRGEAAGFELEQLHRQSPRLGLAELEAVAVRRIEMARITSRIAPLLGLVATMIPMGPALKGLADGDLGEVSRGLTIAFSAVILALIASSLTFWVVSVRRRWYAQELTRIERDLAEGRHQHADSVAGEVPA